MFNSIPIGSVCPFAGQVNPISGMRNDVWDNSACAANNPPQPSKMFDDAPLIYLEAQGWMLCDGRWLVVDDYPELYAVIGHLYGKKTDNQIAMFRIPDYRGLFMRGFDAGAGLDPQAANRNAPTGSSTMNVVGSLQCDAIQEHTHNYEIVQPSGISQQGQAAGTSVTSAKTTSPDKPALSGPETRPRNIAVNYIIRYR